MKRVLRAAALIVPALILGGCPQTPSELIFLPDGETTRTGTGGSRSGGTSTDGTGTDTLSPVAGSTSASDVVVSDALTVRFPGCDEPIEVSLWRADILQLVNEERAAAGVAPVTWNETLAEQAAEYACELIFYDFFAHANPVTGSSLRTRAESFGYTYWIVGENLAAGQRSPQDAMADWMASPCHRQNIMNPAFTELGVGIRYGGTYGYYWVQEFGRPLSDPRYDGPEYHDPECGSS